jgi:1-phosphofructokinase family hexose kinase
VILTLTPNPTIDRAIFVRGFQLGAVVRAEREVVTPSGKGVDASLVIHELGGQTLALGLIAGHTGDLLTAMLDEWGVAHGFCRANGETRTATVLVDLSVGEQSTISTATLSATEAHLARLLEVLDCHAGRAWGLICGGSLPPGLPADSYAHLLRRARECGLVTLLDTSGGALRAGIPGRPDVLKVNREELVALDEGVARLDVCGPQDLGPLSNALRRFLGRWVSEALVITLGELGALAVTGTGVFWAKPPSVRATNTAGAGDALNGGLMLARSRRRNWPSALALGTAAAASVVMNEGTAVCHRAQVAGLLPEVRVYRLDAEMAAGHGISMDVEGLIGAQ